MLRLARKNFPLSLITQGSESRGTSSGKETLKYPRTKARYPFGLLVPGADGEPGCTIRILGLRGEYTILWLETADLGSHRTGYKRGAGKAYFLKMLM